MNNQNEMTIKAIPKGGTAMYVSIICFSVLCFLFWANNFGWLGDATLTLGVCQLAMFPMYCYGGMTALRHDDSFSGTFFISFGTFYGAVGGALNVVGAICEMKGISFSWPVMGIVFFTVGLVVIAMFPKLLYESFVNAGIYLTGGLAPVLWGLVYMNLFPSANKALGTVAAWSIFITGILGMYCIITGILGFKGVKCDFLMGPVLKKKTN